MRHIEAEFMQKWLAWLGPDHAYRIGRINALFEERTATLWATDFHTFSSYHKIQQQTMFFVPVGPDAREDRGYVFYTVTRNLSSMDLRERSYLKLAELLNSAYNGSVEMYRDWRVALIYGGGKGTIEGKTQYLGLRHGEEASDAVRRLLPSVDQTISSMQQHVRKFLEQPQLPPDFRAMLQEFADEVAPAGSGAWLKPSQLASSPFAPVSEYAVRIGSFKDGTPLTYSGEGSIVTIAPPGSGKTQCNVFPNLLTWAGPAVVLDISGDLYENTAAWRAQNVGPVYKFSPLEPADSHKYNPLTFVNSDPDFIWEDSRLLAEMMIVPTMSSDPFWDNEARTVLTAVIAYVCNANPPDQRPMHAVLDVLYGGKPWDNMIRGLRLSTNVRVMTQHATSLSTMNEKTLSSVLQTARSSLSAWAGERIARATSMSDWSPYDLRNGSNPTIYIYIKPNEVESYLSLLRVFIGQHIRMLTGGDVPPRGSAPILFMLDELPRLRNMPPVDEALNIGRKYGLRLWMFAQSVGQLQTAYRNADGMLGACAVRIYMNPSGADGLAEKISEELGYVESLHDNSRRRLVEAAELAGPGYRDRQIVIASGAKPVMVSKDWAHRNPEFKARMEMGTA
ncbi:type IV secretory system conjugative DNA transfer family protein [Mycobacterium asiaticum]|nr:type IV secretory system conjugative DNA transfer family protein [Mycobacterium asiaticum]